MSSNVFRSHVGDTKPVEDLLQRKSSGGVWVAIDLAGASVRFELLRDDVVVFATAATVSDAATGKVRYGWGAGGNGLAGTFGRRWEITFADGTIETVPDHASYPVVFEA